MKYLLISLFSLSAFAFNLKFHRQIVMPQGEVFKNTKVGGLSGIRYDKETNTIFAISDDRARKAPARFYKYLVSTKSNQLNIELNDVITLKDKGGKDFKKGSIDFEDIEFIENDLLITSEGNLGGRFIQPPRVVRFSKDGKYVKDLNVDNKFKPLRKNGFFVRGIRNNLSFEPLAMTRDNEYFFTATEDSLIQDGPVAGLKSSSSIRMIRYKKFKNNFSPIEEFVYPLGAINPLQSTPKSLAAQTGIPAILALSKDSLLVMERTYYPLQDRTTVKLYKSEIAKNTTNVKELFSLKNKDFIPMSRELAFDLDNYRTSFNTNYKSLDNIEGMCLGPDLPNGNKTLILVSDNNFSRSQRTHFLVFEIVR